MTVVPGIYTAWNGKEYPWPPPTRWQLRADGRYWPSDAPAAGASPGPPSPSSSTSGPGSPPMSTSPMPLYGPGPGPAPFPNPAPGYPPGAAPRPVGGGQTYYKQNNSGCGMGAVLVFVAACLLLFFLPVVLFTRLGVQDGFLEDDFADDPFFADEQFFADDAGQLSQPEIDRLVEITRCDTFDGQPTADGTILNNTNGERDFAITLEFRDSTGRLLDGFVDVRGVPGEEISFTGRSAEFSTGDGLECDVASVFRFVR